MMVTSARRKLTVNKTSHVAPATSAFLTSDEGWSRCLPAGGPKVTASPRSGGASGCHGCLYGTMYARERGQRVAALGGRTG
ncbi:hypothetical protein BN6_26580 [Saccharothrix espanaensis DSM 44229]|uniref:Uncharacterized protein n=1 Tax=Saccharothrix espanaensis (strain ATCC 51144 / DSM 44229 / JCM 9112 / NBRC 15066 / NRRL 15764) TaxID=1179773 RepID=K0JVG9_SACES|nr:hypothetical protein BN6_26580 [Saccharothrix espanaensis DSM 44229]